MGLFTLTWEGFGEATLREHGKVVAVRYSDNFLTNVGIKHLAKALSLTPETTMSYIGIGTGSGQTKLDTSLDNQLVRKALSATYPKVDASPNTNWIIYQAYFSPGVGTGQISESAVFNSSTGGTMLNYFIWNPPLDKDSPRDLTLQLKGRLGVLA